MDVSGLRRFKERLLCMETTFGQRQMGVPFSTRIGLPFRRVAPVYHRSLGVDASVLILPFFIQSGAPPAYG